MFTIFKKDKLPNFCFFIKYVNNFLHYHKTLTIILVLQKLLTIFMMRIHFNAVMSADKRGELASATAGRGASA